MKFVDVTKETFQFIHLFLFLGLYWPFLFLFTFVYVSRFPRAHVFSHGFSRVREQAAPFH